LGCRLEKVTITYDDIEIEFLPDYVEDVMLVRSIEKNQRKTVQLDSKPVIRNDRTYLPYRAISEAFGYKVYWMKKNIRLL